MRTDSRHSTPSSGLKDRSIPPPVGLSFLPADAAAARDRAVDCMLDDCFFAVGQAVGTRKALGYEAMAWWRDHYRVKFQRAAKRFGHRWLRDRAVVTSVGLLLGERAVRYAGDALEIDVSCAQQAAADVERYCQLRSRRAGRAGLTHEAGDTLTLLVGYWCGEVH